MSIAIYRISKAFFLTKGVVDRLEGKMVILYPSGGVDVIKRIGRQLIRIYLIAIITIFLLFMFADISIYYSAIAVATVYVIMDTSIRRSFDKLENQLLNEFLQFIESIKFRFQFDGMLEEALLDAIGESGEYMAVHGQIIYEHLMESYFKDRGDYGDICPNHFFLTFYSLCESIMKYGDKKMDDGSLFVKNLGYLKEDITIEILKRKSVENTFLGILTICILPVYCIKPIEMWALSNMPELETYFIGQSGTISTIILTILSLSIYQIVKSLKYPSAQHFVKKNWVKKLSKIQFIKRMNTLYMNRFLKSVTATNKLLRAISYGYNIEEFCIKRWMVSIEAFLVGLVISITIGLGWMSIIIGAMIFILVFKGQVLAIQFRRQLLLLEREDEIIRFQGIILMLIHADRITVEQILEQLERFAISFKSEIEEISDKLSYMGMSIFKEFRDKSDFLPFNRLIDGFIACDSMYIYKAFEDVEKDRKYYIEKHKQENAYYIEQRGAIGKFLSFIPLCTVIIAKLVIPFVLEGMKQMAMGNMNL